ncbi:MAG: hypothetical protein AAFR61_05555 [Bacteroidota bacterium]
MANYEDNPSKYQQLWVDGYNFDFGRYISKGFSLFGAFPFGFIFHLLIGFLMVIVGGLVVGLVVGAVAGGIFSSIATGGDVGIFSIIFGIILYLAMTAAMGGLFLSVLAGIYPTARQISQTGTKEFGTLFSAFNSFLQLSLFLVISLVIYGLIFFVSSWITGFSMVSMMEFADVIDPMDPTSVLSFYAQTGILSAIGVSTLLSIYFSVAWGLTVPFIVLGKMRFWDAMETSRKIVTRKWFHFFGLTLVVWIISIAVLLTVGLIGGLTESAAILFLMMIAGYGFMVPYTFLVNYSVYEDIVMEFSDDLTDKIDNIGDDFDPLDEEA